MALNVQLRILQGFRDNLSGRPAEEVLWDIAQAIREARSFLVTGHVNPDGDSLGSGVALALGLRQLGKEALVVLADPLPERYRPFAPPGLLQTADDRWVAAAPERFDWCAVLDTSEPERLGKLRPLVFARGQRRFCLDHHLEERQGLYDHHLVVKEVPATATLTLALLDLMKVRLTREIARVLWLALSSDTGWFRFSNTTPDALGDAARLLATGLDPERLYEQIYGSHRLERMRLFGDILAALRTAHEGRFVWGVATRAALERRRVEPAELEGVIDHLKSVRGVQIAALISETDDGAYKVSLRSMGASTVDRIARRFSGGGHAKAAGFRYQGRLEDLEDELVRAAALGFGPRAASGDAGTGA